MPRSMLNHSESLVLGCFTLCSQVWDVALFSTNTCWKIKIKNTWLSFSYHSPLILSLFSDICFRHLLDAVVQLQSFLQTLGTNLKKVLGITTLVLKRCCSKADSSNMLNARVGAISGDDQSHSEQAERLLDCNSGNIPKGLTWIVTSAVKFFSLPLFLCLPSSRITLYLSLSSASRPSNKAITRRTIIWSAILLHRLCNSLDMTAYFPCLNVHIWVNEVNE